MTLSTQKNRSHAGKYLSGLYVPVDPKYICQNYKPKKAAYTLNKSNNHPKENNEFGIDFKDEAAFDDFTPREIHIPKGKPVLLKIRARDVLHSVFAPHFRLKMDAVPGMPTSFWFIPSKSTAEMRVETGNPDFNYEIACAEVCGRGHFSMRMLVVVDEPEDYQKWKSEQETWLSKNQDYLSQVPENLKELALLKTGLIE